jgi:hypothetical protein
MIEYKARAFDADLQELARRLQKCVAVDDGQIADAIDAWAKRDKALAKRVTASDELVRSARLM